MQRMKWCIYKIYSGNKNYVIIKEVEDKNRLLAEQNEEMARLQEQASLKLDEVKAIIEELKGLIVNA